MIYLIETTYYIKETKKVLDLVKIGYTDNKDKRLYTYKNHNPLCKVLFTVDDGTEEDETNLHYHFRKYKYPDYGHEWFFWSPEIVDFFRNHKTIESIRSDVSWSPLVDRDRRIELVHDAIQYINQAHEALGIPYNPEERKEISIKAEDLVAIEKPQNRKELREVVEMVYNVSLPPDTVEDDLVEFLKKFNSFTQFPEKMEYLCGLGLEKEKMDRFLNIIPFIFKNYYLVLGPERIKAFSYRKSYLEDEYSKQFQQQNTITDLDTLVYSRISIGDRYSKRELKELLRTLYELASYPANPKAKDIEKWFDIRSFQMTNKISGKRDNGFEIIKKKDI